MKRLLAKMLKIFLFSKIKHILTYLGISLAPWSPRCFSAGGKDFFVNISSACYSAQVINLEQRYKPINICITAVSNLVHVIRILFA